jgi:hypothetical protein
LPVKLQTCSLPSHVLCQPRALPLLQSFQDF